MSKLETMSPVADWENASVKGMALCAESIYRDRIEKVESLRKRQEDYKASLPTHPSEASRKILADLPDMSELAEATYAPRGALTLLNELAIKRSFDDGVDLNDAVYWLTSQALEGLRTIETGNKRVRDIAQKVLEHRHADLASEAEFQRTVRQLEPELQDGLLTLMRAVVLHDLPMEGAHEAFAQVVKEFRQKDAS